MSMQFGRVSAKPVPIGRRIGGRLLLILIVGIPAMVASFLMSDVMVAAFLGESAGWQTMLLLVLLLISLGISIWQLVLFFKESTTIGGKLLGFKWIIPESGEDAKVRVFLKYLLQGVFESFTLGLGAISYLVTYRDGQHWIDRAIGVVGVETASVTASRGMSPTMHRAPAGHTGPAVMPVSMPRQQAQPSQPPLPPQGGPAASAYQPPVYQPPTAQPPAAQPQGFAPANPWSQPASEPEPVTNPYAPEGAPRSFGPPPSSVPSDPFEAPRRSTSQEPSFGPPSTSAPVFGGGAPQPSAGNPFSRPPTSAPVPQPTGPTSFTPPFPAPGPAAGPIASFTPPPSSSLDDRTVVDAEQDDAPVVVLDDGQEIIVDGPVVLGRNPSAPAAYSQARPVQLLDDSMRLSKTHAVLVPFGDGVGVYDVGATNGVSISVDGSKTKLAANKLHELPAGAELHVGGRTLRVRP
ncbi:MAG TPA: hypothetical protein PKE40_06100 [Arachnia sp.]|nr:hypothetical protein [Arachnia sp.]HMT85908.1 hypothetical protein [Arachnia sp.]